MFRTGLGLLQTAWLKEVMGQFRKRAQPCWWEHDGSQGVNTNAVFIDMSRDIGVTITPADISVSHRLWRPGDSSVSDAKPRPLIVKLVRRDNIIELMRNKKKMRSMDKHRQVYVNDDLTMQRRWGRWTSTDRSKWTTTLQCREASWWGSCRARRKSRVCGRLKAESTARSTVMVPRFEKWSNRLMICLKARLDGGQDCWRVRLNISWLTLQNVEFIRTYQWLICVMTNNIVIFVKKIIKSKCIQCNFYETWVRRTCSQLTMTQCNLCKLNSYWQGISIT